MSHLCRIFFAGAGAENVKSLKHLPATETVFTMSLAEFYLHLPYEKRWEHHRPTILKINLEEKGPLRNYSSGWGMSLDSKPSMSTPFPRVSLHL